MKRRFFWLSLSAGIVLGVVAVDGFVRGRSPLAEGPPIFDWTHALRTLLFAGASWLAAAALRPRAKCGSGEASPGEMAPDRGGRPAVWAVLALSVACVGLFVADPAAFGRLCVEDAPVEDVSALSVFAAAILLFAGAFRLRRAARPLLYGTLGLAMFVLLIGLEEVSWFQRALQVESPRIFARENSESEINLHNFATGFSEDVYYFGIFVMLVALPFAAEGRLTDRPIVGFFQPGARTQDLAAIPVAYNYDMWNQPLMQVAFYASLFILVHRAREATDSRTKRLIAAVAVSVVASQAVFLALGRGFVREWDVTEYKEMFIPLALLGYALELQRRARSLPPELAVAQGRA